MGGEDPRMGDPISTAIMRIIVAGDSWACGEWGQDDRGEYGVLHLGLTQCLREQGHSVTVTAWGGSTNWQQLRRVRDPRADLVVFVQTDPMRDRAQIPGLWEDYHREYRRGLDLLYQGLAALPCPVLLVGGNTAVAPERVPPGVRVAVRDWVEALVGHRPLTIMGRSWPYPDCDPPLLSLWEREEQALQEWDHRCRLPGTPEHEWFWPDSRHPNRRAHRWLADRILPLLPAQ
jgi:hypothetical protein